jgi:hypothetical protein
MGSLNVPVMYCAHLQPLEDVEEREPIRTLLTLRAIERWERPRWRCGRDRVMLHRVLRDEESIGFQDTTKMTPKTDDLEAQEEEYKIA